MLLKPSDIYYCQNSIKNTFSNGKKIGETLDDLCEGRTSLSSFPKIRVTQKNSKWYTTDNRRLWIFRHLYRLGKCGEIPVVQTGDIPSRKMTTSNGGVSIAVRGRGGPGGVWQYKHDGAGRNLDGTYACTWPEDSVCVSSSYFDFDIYDSDDFGYDFSDNECFGYDSDNDFW